MSPSRVSIVDAPDRAAVEAAAVIWREVEMERVGAPPYPHYFDDQTRGVVDRIADHPGVVRRGECR